MTKKLLTMLIISTLLISSSMNALFERTKNFFKGLGTRSKQYYYVDDQGNRHYYDIAYQKPHRHGSYYQPVEDVLTSNKTSIIENKNQYVVTLILPGYDKNDVHVSALERSLQIHASGHKIEQSALENPPLTTFDQTIPLEHSIAPQEVQSQYLNGVLTITAPKVDTPAKKVEVPIS